MFDNYAAKNDVTGRSVNHDNGITPSELSTDERKELDNVAGRIQEETSEYLTKGYEIGVRSVVKQGSVVIWVEVICPTGQVMQMNVIPSIDDVANDVERNENDGMSCDDVSKEFVAQMINELLTQQEQCDQRSMPAS